MTVSGGPAQPTITCADGVTLNASSNTTYTVDVSGFAWAWVDVAIDKDHTLYFRGSVLDDDCDAIRDIRRHDAAEGRRPVVHRARSGLSPAGLRPT